jgi:uncharacterized damage-inducible protein DinB
MEMKMDTQEKRLLIVNDKLSREPEISRWLWALEDGRVETLERLDGMDPAMVDWLPPDDQSSIGSVLYHVALIEADWLYSEVLVQPYPTAVIDLFPIDHRDEQGRLSQVVGESLGEHLARLAKVRQLLLDVFEPMDLADFRRIRSLPAYDVTPEWVLHHLIQHEAEHRSQMHGLRLAAERQFVGVV